MSTNQTGSPQFTPLSSITASIKELAFKASAALAALPAGWIVSDEREELLRAETEPPALKLCGALAYTNEIAVIGGDDKSGKSKFIDSMIWAMLEGQPLAPDLMCEVPPEEIRAAGLDLELTSSANVKRNKHKLEKFIGTGRYIKIRPDYSAQGEIKDRIQHIIEVIRALAEQGRNVILWDNVMAWLGDISDNKEWVRLFQGLRSVIDDQRKKGKWLAIFCFVHLTKSAVDRRHKPGEAISRKGDLRGAGAMQSLAGSVMEIRPSDVDESLSILHLFNTRHDKSEVDVAKKKGYGFRTDHTEGSWKHAFESIVHLPDHFGSNAGLAPNSVKDAGKISPEMQAQIRSLHHQGSSDNFIWKELKARAGGTNAKRGTYPGKDALTAWMRANGLESNYNKSAEHENPER